jgi:hydroxyethylthiazole kinase
MVDIVSDGKREARISNGDVMLSKVVGTGCMSSVIVASFAAVDPDPFMAATGGLTAFGIAGEMAAAVAGGRPGTFHMELYNALHALTPAEIESRARVELNT